MAQDQAPHARIASLLDDTEYLLALMQSPEDDTQLFVDYLEDTTARCGCSGVFDEFTQPAVTRVG